LSGRATTGVRGIAAGLAGAAVLALSLAAGHASAAEISAAAVRGWLAGFPATVLRDRARVEAGLRTRLSARDENGAFAFWAADAATVAGLTITAVDYRQPQAGGGATAGPLLALDVAAEPCLARTDLVRALPDLQFSDMTPHDVPEARTYWSRRAGGVRASFGFPVRGRDCLRAIVLAVDRP
jgi:hypothetical protein